MKITREQMAQMPEKERVLAFCEPENTPQTIADVELFFDALSGYLVWHPDNSFTDYEHRDSHERSFTDLQALALDQAMHAAFDVCDANDREVYELGMEALKRAGRWSEPPEPVTKEDVSPRQRTLTEEQRLVLAREVFNRVFLVVHEFGNNNIGCCLAYLLGAIIGEAPNSKGESVDWSNEGVCRPTFELFERLFEPEHPVWRFIVRPARPERAVLCVRDLLNRAQIHLKDGNKQAAESVLVPLVDNLEFVPLPIRKLVVTAHNFARIGTLERALSFVNQALRDLGPEVTAEPA